MHRLYLNAIVMLGLATEPGFQRLEQSAELAGGLTELYPWEGGEENLVKNSSFEEIDETGKPIAWTMTARGPFHLTEEDAYSGKRSILLKESHLDRWTPSATQSTELAEGWYDLSGWVKAKNAGTNKAGAGGRIAVWQKSENGGGAATPAIRGTTEWTKLEHKRFSFPGGSAEIRLGAYRKPDGSVYFDGIELRRLIPPVVEGFLLYPNYRGILFPDRPQSIRLSVTVRPEEVKLEPSDMRVEMTLVPEEGREPVLSIQQVPPSAEFVLELDAKELRPGPYSLNLRAVRQQSGETIASYPSYRILKISPAEQDRFRTYIDDDNVLVLDGTRTFALGIYNTGGYSSSPKAYEKLASKLAEAPLNLYINYWLGGAPNEALSALTETLGKYGIYYLHTVNAWYENNKWWPKVPPCEKAGGGRAHGEAEYVSCRARELGSIRGLAGWYTADEQFASEVERIFGQYRLLRANDPDGVTFIAQNKIKEIGQWRDATDVIGIDPYPIYNIPEGQLAPLEMVIDWVDTAQFSVQRRRPVWPVIQFFRFGKKGHWPTQEELRSMSYMAIIAGAKGLFYWSYGAAALDWVKDPKRKEELWQRLVAVTKEIKSFEPVLLEPDSPEVLENAPSSSPIRVLAKKHQDERFVFAVNPLSKEVTAHFRLAEPAEQVTVDGENRTISLDSSASFRDSFGPYAVHIYRISRRARDPGK